MEHVIQFTLPEAWAVFLSICGGIVTISAAVTVIIKIVKYFKKPNLRQEERIALLESRVDHMEDRFDETIKEYMTFFQKDKDRLDVIEQGNRIMQEAMLALLSHGIDGDDVDQMKAAKKNLEQYLINK